MLASGVQRHDSVFVPVAKRSAHLSLCPCVQQEERKLQFFSCICLSRSAGFLKPHPGTPGMSWNSFFFSQMLLIACVLRGQGIRTITSSWAWGRPSFPEVPGAVPGLPEMTALPLRLPRPAHAFPWEVEFPNVTPLALALGEAHLVIS